jgi:AraC family transcriptional regulator, regulatory protein of adaptative response / DNA-3-methyladenine glycosylase II
MNLDSDICYRALVARDARFDGVFFVGVTTTRIYCRPVCTARTPGRERCRFFPSAAAAECARFRPCLRCRPELAPGNAPVDSPGRVARATAARIEAGALDDGGSLEALAGEFGLSSRQLRRAVRQELGASPIELAQTRRLLMAKKMLTETNLPVIEVAYASGFASLRRFNALFQSHYRLTPSQMRRSNGSCNMGQSLRLRLAYRAPLAWPEMLQFLAARALPGVEFVSGIAYARTVALGKHRGWLRVEPAAKRDELVVETSPALTPALAPLLARLRNLFDLCARPDMIAAHLGADGRIGPLVQRCPGLRVPCAFCGFELTMRAVLGQHVNVRSATTVAGRLVLAFGESISTPFPELTHLSPTAERLAEATVGKLAVLGMPGRRAETLRGLAGAAAVGDLRLAPGSDGEEVVARLLQFPGVGEWTAQYIAMRAARWPDAFPHDDLGLRKAADELSRRQLQHLAEAWRPWRAYAAMHLWHSVSLSRQEAAIHA